MNAQQLDKLEKLVTDLSRQFDGMKAANSLTVLTTAYIAAFGQEGARLALSRGGDKEFMERQLFYSGLSVPGYDFGPLEQKFGPRKELFGFRRTLAAPQQERINAALKAA